MSKKKSEATNASSAGSRSASPRDADQDARAARAGLHRVQSLVSMPGAPFHADGYMLIHCLWVVGKSKGKGLSTALLDACVADAKKQRLKGVAMVTSEKVWLSGRRVLDKHGFECVDTAAVDLLP